MSWFMQMWFTSSIFGGSYGSGFIFYTYGVWLKWIKQWKRGCWFGVLRNAPVTEGATVIWVYIQPVNEWKVCQIIYITATTAFGWFWYEFFWGNMFQRSHFPTSEHAVASLANVHSLVYHVSETSCSLNDSWKENHQSRTPNTLRMPYHPPPFIIHACTVHCSDEKPSSAIYSPVLSQQPIKPGVIVCCW